MGKFKTIHKAQILLTIKNMTMFTTVIEPFTCEKITNIHDIVVEYRFNIRVKDEAVQKMVENYLNSLSDYEIREY